MTKTTLGLLLASLIAVAAAPAPSPSVTPSAAPAAVPAVNPATDSATPPARPSPQVLKLGQCVRTSVAAIGQRLMDARTGKPMHGSGSTIRYRNHIEQVSYEQIGSINRSRRGDPVEICLVQVPSACPPGDDRGKIYKATNLRLKSTWTLPDSEHSCGGA